MFPPNMTGMVGLSPLQKKPKTPLISQGQRGLPSGVVQSAARQGKRPSPRGMAGAGRCPSLQGKHRSL